MKTCMVPAAFALLATSLIAADSASGPGPAAAGKWASEFDTPVGHLKYVYEFKASGDKLTGTAVREREGAKTEIELKDAAVTGDQVSFAEPLKIQDQDVRIEYKGKLAGDEMKLTRKVGDFGSMDIVAHRLKENAGSLDGKWNAQWASQIGNQKYIYELKTEGEKLTGKAIGESRFGKFETAITEGKANPDKVFFVEQLKLPDNEIRIEYSGKLAGDELKLTRKVGDITSYEIVAKRAPAPTQK